MASLLPFLIPVFVIVGLLVLLLALNLLARVQGGRYVRPIGLTLMKVPFLKNWMQKASRASLERKNPELASAMTKLERSGVQNDPQRAQAALSRLSASERRAWLEAAGEEGAIPEPMNRQQRRQAAKLKKRR
jgi:MoxR-like ATPase